MMEALNIIEEALSGSIKPVVAFSGGKDSTVILDLVRKIDKTVPGVFCNTGVELPQTKKYVRSLDNIFEIQNETKETFWSIVEKEGFPGIKGKDTGSGRLNRCCLVLKDRPMKKFIKENDIDLVFTGLTMDESRQRMMFLMSNGNKGRVKLVKSWQVYKSHPIWNWSESRVWEYINENKLPYNDIYKPPINAERCGCGPCTAYLPWKRNLSRENPKLLKVILEKQGQPQLENFCMGGA